ncbi:MAG: MFS transporter [Candidatus Bathyarchaeia archaeon]|jgi:MFS family permease
MNKLTRNLDKRLRIHYGWICATGGIQAFLILATSTATLPLVLVALGEALGITNGEAGTIFAPYGVFFIIGALSWGLLADKIGLRKSLTLSSLMLSIGIVGMGTINSTIMGMFFYSIIGFAAGAPTTLSAILTRAWFDKSKRGIAQSYITSPRTLYTAILGIMVPLILLAYGWRSVWYFLGAVNLFFSVLVYSLVRDDPKEKNVLPYGASPNENHNSKNLNGYVSKMAVLKKGITWHLGAIFVLNVFIIKAFNFFVVAYLISEVGLTPVEAGGAFSVFALSMMVGGYVWGFLSDYIARKYVVALGSILYAIFLLAFIIFGNEIIAIYILAAAVGFAIGTPAVTFAMVSDYFPLNVTGTASGIINAISGVGFLLGPLVAGGIITATGNSIPAFEVAVIVAVSLAVVSLSLRQPTRKDCQDRG